MGVLVRDMDVQQQLCFGLSSVGRMLDTTMVARSFARTLDFATAHWRFVLRYSASGRGSDAHDFKFQNAFWSKARIFQLVGAQTAAQDVEEACARRCMRTLACAGFVLRLDMAQVICNGLSDLGRRVQVTTTISRSYEKEGTVGLSPATIPGFVLAASAMSSPRQRFSTAFQSGSVVFDRNLPIVASSELAAVRLECARLCLEHNSAGPAAGKRCLGFFLMIRSDDHVLCRGLRTVGSVSGTRSISESYLLVDNRNV